MQQEYSLLKQENFQLKNEISELKNAFDLNRDILIILSQQAKKVHPNAVMLYQIISRLTSINNQIMINSADLILQKNNEKLTQKQQLKQKLQAIQENLSTKLLTSQNPTTTDKPTQLHLYLSNRVNELQQEIKSLQEERMLMEQEIKQLSRKVSFYQCEQQKCHMKPIVNNKTSSGTVGQQMLVKRQNEKVIKLNRSQELISLQSKIKKKHHQGMKQTRFQVKLNLISKEMKKMKIYTEELQYRLLTLIKVVGLQDNIKKTSSTINTKAQRRKCLQLQYERQVLEVKLLKFALKNLQKQEKNNMIQPVRINNRIIQTSVIGYEPLFTLTNRKHSSKDLSRMFVESRNRMRYLHKSVEKENRVRMKPVIREDTIQDEDEDQQEYERYRN